MNFNEKKLATHAKSYLINARAGDWNHALRVVNWVKKLGNKRKDLHLIITAAYIHDIGWSGVAPHRKLDITEMLKLEEKANKNSSKFIRQILSKMMYSKQEIETVIRLVKAADEHKSNKDDEAIIVDADNLSKLYKDHIVEKYQPESYGKIIALVETKLSKHIKTKKALAIYPRLLSKVKRDLKNYL